MNDIEVDQINDAYKHIFIDSLSKKTIDDLIGQMPSLWHDIPLRFLFLTISLGFLENITWISLDALSLIFVGAYLSPWFHSLSLSFVMYDFKGKTSCLLMFPISLRNELFSPYEENITKHWGPKPREIWA